MVLLSESLYMKNSILSFVAFMWFLTPATPPLSLENQLIIHVTDTSGNSLIGASITVEYNDRIIKQGVTDVTGVFKWETEIEIVDIVVSNMGYESQYMEGIKVDGNPKYVTLKGGPKLEEILISDHSSPKSKKITSDLHESFDSEASPSLAAPGLSLSSASRSTKIRGIAPEPSLPGSGQITAGEWNDLHNWKAWQELINGDEYQSMIELWNTSTTERYSVLVLNEQKIPIPGASAIMYDKKGNELWSARTDISGKAELFLNPYMTHDAIHLIKVRYNDQVKTIRQVTRQERGAMMIHFSAPCLETVPIEISWVVDATSSMSDEIKYLQSELLNVIERVKSEGPSIRWSSIFYRDLGDQYLTKIQDFNKDPQEILDFIKQQHADGGGDFPEAVSEALQQMTQLNWSNDDGIKLCFLLLDAPPHEDQESMNMYRKAVQRAAAMGIQIIPITASGINRETEFLMKFTSILTNGTYVFITDDSGIGNAHLDPVVKDYEVEKLNDLLVRLIQSFTTLPECVPLITEVRKKNIKFYPNPAKDFVTIENLSKGQRIQLISSSGMILKAIDADAQSILRMEISDLVAGHYLLRIIDEGSSQDFRLLVIT